MIRSSHRVLILSVLIGGFLRFFMLGYQSLWVDETGTLLNVLYPDISIAHFAFHANNAPPLYYWVLKPFMALLGESEYSVRFLSALVGICSIPIFWLVAIRLSRKKWVANLSAALLAVNPLHLWFSQEARSYSFFLFLFLLCAWVFLRAMDRPQEKSVWAGLAIGLILLAATHTLAITAGIVFCGWFFLIHPTWRKFFRLSVVGSLFSSVWVFLVLHIQRVGSVAPPARAFTGLEIPYTFFSYLSGYSFGPSIREIQVLGSKEALVLHAVPVLLAGLVLGGIGLVALKKSRRDHAPVYIWMATPVIVSVLIALGTPHAYNVRFALPALPAFLLWVSLLISECSARQRRVFLSIFFGLSLWASAQWFLIPDYGKEDTRAALEEIVRVRPDVHKIAVAPDYMEDTLYYYLLQQGSKAWVASVSTEADIGSILDADALLITRRHHVPFAKELREKFMTVNADRDLKQFVETGYEIIVAMEPSDSYSLISVPVNKMARFPNDQYSK